jgi:F-type H+-transporting ATPase subunit gamma
MANWKEIKQRIKSVSSTWKITKAMELISTVKMKKSQENVLASRPFAIESLKILSNIITDDNSDISFLSWPKKKLKKELIVITSSNKWLCWWYNINTFKQVSQYIKWNDHCSYDYMTVWKKAQDFILRTWWNLITDFSEIIKDNIEIYDTKKISKNLLTIFKEKKYDKIVIFYNYYISAIKQQNVVKQFLPIDKTSIIEYLENVVWLKSEEFKKKHHFETKDIVIEPSKEIIILEVIPMILDLMFYEFMLEAKASEHASRMVAMKNAKDSANKKVFELTLTYNKARQASITREISEIVAWVESTKD